VIHILDLIIVVPYDHQWKNEFQQIGSMLRDRLGDLAIRIDHIGSTSVMGLDAKPIIDIQISVSSLEPMVYKQNLEDIGYLYREQNPDKSKRYFRESNNMRRTHIHVREHGCWSEQFALLFRDYLRTHPNDCREYVEVKYNLMKLYRNNRERYVEEKDPIIWTIMNKASKWSQEIGWKPGKSDL